MSNTWKVSMTASPNAGFVLVSLNNVLNGGKLPHDIIIKYSDYYATSGGLNMNKDGISASEVWNKTVDFFVPEYSADEIFFWKEVLIDGVPYKIKCHDPKAAILPDFSSNAEEADALQNLAIIQSMRTGSPVNFADLSNYELPNVTFSGSDSVFESTINFSGSQEAYTSLTINPQDLLHAVIDSIEGKPSDITLNAKNLEPEVLDNIFIYVKAPFAADYINPVDFNQDLSQKADVAHSNLILSGPISRTYDKEGAMTSEEYDDFTRYDTTSNPYVPKLSPVKDLLSKTLRGENYLSISRNVNGPIGHLFSERDLTPVSYFEPASLNLGENNTWTSEDEDIDKKTLLPSKGNIISAGRILSPTIDEINYIIEKIISGSTIYGNGTSDSTLLDHSYIEGVDFNSGLNEINEYRQITFQYGDNSVKATPINYEVDINDNGNKSLRYTEYVKSPEEFFHGVYESIGNNKSNVEKFSEGKPVTYSVESTERKYQPADHPFSLRELEAYIKGNKYNLESLFEYVTKNFAVAGGRGKTTNDGSAGSLYTLHKDYNFTPENPNTVFGKDDETTTDIVYDDYEGSEETYSPNESINEEYFGNSVKDSYKASEVYLAADGTWRYINEHVRIPKVLFRF